MAIALVGTPPLTSHEGSFNGAGPFTTSVDCGAGSDRGLLVAILTNGVTAWPITATYDGAAMSFTAEQTVSGRTYAWAYLSNPSSGSNTLSIQNDIGDTATYWILPIALTGVHQTTASLIDTPANATGTTSPITVDITCPSGDLAVSIGYVEASGASNSITTDGSQTEIAQDDAVNGSAIMAAVSYEAGAGTTTMSYTFADASGWGTQAINVNAAAAGTEPTLDTLSHASFESLATLGQTLYVVTVTGTNLGTSGGSWTPSGLNWQISSPGTGTDTSWDLTFIFDPGASGTRSFTRTTGSGTSNAKTLSVSVADGGGGGGANMRGGFQN